MRQSKAIAAAGAVALLAVIALAAGVVHGGSSGQPSPAAAATWPHTVIPPAPGTVESPGYGDPAHPSHLSIVLLGLTTNPQLVSGSPSPPVSTGKTGHHPFAVQISITNNGPGTFSGNILAGAVVTTRDGISTTAASNLTVSNGPALPAGTVTLQPQGNVLGWIVWMVPNDHLITTLSLLPAGPNGAEASWSIAPPTFTPLAATSAPAHT